jgi:hypothetical protein
MIAPTIEDDSDGPMETPGWQRWRKTRRQPWRDGFAFQSVIETIDDPKCYRRLEQTLISNIAPRTAIELELVHRLASLFWRLRRADAVENGLFALQADNCSQNHRPNCGPNFGHSTNIRTIARHFTLLSKRDATVLDRIGAHQTRLWRQVMQIIWIIETLRHPPPSPRRTYRKPTFATFVERC